MAEQVRIVGLAELDRKFWAFDADTKKGLRVELRAIAEPIARDVRGIAERWGAPTASGVGTGTRGAAAIVRQRRGRTTGLRPDFGALQMRQAFIPSAKEHEPELGAKVQAMLDRNAAKFN